MKLKVSIVTVASIHQSHNELKEKCDLFQRGKAQDARGVGHGDLSQEVAPELRSKGVRK